MKKHLLLILLFLTNFLFSQNYKLVDSIVDSYSKDLNNIDELVSKINSDFKTESEKARASFCWISKNISYDIEFSKTLEINKIKAFSYKNDIEKIKKEKEFNLELANKTFKSRLAVCYGYAALFDCLTSKLNLESKLIRGNLKSKPSEINGLFDVNHGWNAVRINNIWQLVDCTIAAGNISSKSNEFVFNYNDGFFFTNPELFSLNHYPENEKWLFIKLSKKEYLQQPIYYPEYFKENFNLKTSNIGIIENSAMKFQFSFNNPEILENTVKYYTFVDKKFEYIQNIDNSLNYEIPLEGKSNDFVIIYINGKPIIGYKKT